MRGAVWGSVAAAYLAACIMLGGASAAGGGANALLQGLAVVLIAALIATGRFVLPPEARPLAWIVTLYVLVALLSMVPLPPDLWQGLPYRGEVAEGLRLLGYGAAWQPISLAWQATLTSLLWLLPPIAMFLLTVSLGEEDRRRIPGTLAVMAVLSIALGIFQLIGGQNSTLRFYDITNSDSPVGFFSNINHQATLLLCALPCAGYMGARFATRRDRSRRSGGAVITGAFLTFLVLGIALAGSMAGYGLFIPAAFATLLIYRRAVAGRLTLAWKAGLAVVLALFVAGSLLGPLSRETLAERFGEQQLSRATMATTTLDAIALSFPLGTGLGTFSTVYRRFEDPRQTTNIFANHAHNDYIEIALELGLAGVLLVLAFAAWWLVRTIRVWSTDFSGAAMARAGSVMIGIVLLHSLVDYPIRTSAIAALVAAGCALMVPRPPRPKRRAGTDAPADEGLKHLVAE